MDKPLTVLGIETSCDETAAAVVCAAPDPASRILGHVVVSQLEEHRPFGGVVPEVAARAHLHYLDRLVVEALKKADVEFSNLDGVAVTGGPGLIGGVMVGVMMAKAIATVHKLPFLAVNHLEAHALTARLTNDVDFPFLLLLVSGGHCQTLIVSGVGKYERLGTTIDDALGEAFDKVAKMIGLGYPGGPAVEAAAKKGDPTRFDLPRPMARRAGCHFSFSGLKTAVRQRIEKLPPGPISDQDAADLCASFQAAAADVLDERVGKALDIYNGCHPSNGSLVVAGGVAANQFLRTRLERLAQNHGVALVAPPLNLCTDNAAMVAWTGVERLALGQSDPLDFAPRPRWPLDPDAPKAEFAGAKG